MCFVQLYVWRENDQVVRRCRWVAPRTSLCVEQFAVGACCLAVISNDGQAFTGNIPVTQPSSHNYPLPLPGDYESLPWLYAVMILGTVLFCSVIGLKPSVFKDTTWIQHDMWLCCNDHHSLFLTSSLDTVKKKMQKEHMPNIVNDVKKWSIRCWVGR